MKSWGQTRELKHITKCIKIYFNIIMFHNRVHLRKPLYFSTLKDMISILHRTQKKYLLHIHNFYTASFYKKYQLAHLYINANKKNVF